jgi:hypothetical protein
VTYSLNSTGAFKEGKEKMTVKEKEDFAKDLGGMIHLTLQVMMSDGKTFKEAKEGFIKIIETCRLTNNVIEMDIAL